MRLHCGCPAWRLCSWVHCPAPQQLPIILLFPITIIDTISTTTIITTNITTTIIATSITTTIIPIVITFLNLAEDQLPKDGDSNVPKGPKGIILVLRLAVSPAVQGWRHQARRAVDPEPLEKRIEKRNKQATVSKTATSSKIKPNFPNLN